MSLLQRFRSRKLAQNASAMPPGLWRDIGVAYARQNVGDPAVADAALRRLLYDPFLKPYRGDPRFTAFCRKVGSPAPGQGRSP